MRINNKKINEFASKIIDNRFAIGFLKILINISGKKGGGKGAAVAGTKTEIKKMLVIKLEGLGDCVYLLEAIHRIKGKYGGLIIDILTTKQNPIFSVIGEGCGEFNVVSFNPLSLLEYFRVIRLINKGGYDVIFDMTGMPVNIPLMLYFAKPYKVGFDSTRLRSVLYDRLAELSGEIHIFDNYLNLFTPFFDIAADKVFTLRPAGLGNDAASPLLEPAKEGEKFLSAGKRDKKAVRGGHAKCINLVLSSNSGGLMHRKLPLANSLKLINLLESEFDGYEVNLLGGSGDYEYLESVCENLKKTGSGRKERRVAVRKTKDIKEAFLLLRKGFFNICIDSGLMHISSLVNPNTYCLFGYSNPLNSLPFNNIGYFRSNPDCSPCSFYKIGSCIYNLKCMEDIDIDAVVNDIKTKMLFA